jgi:hypothetical protein
MRAGNRVCDSFDSDMSVLDPNWIAGGSQPMKFPFVFSHSDNSFLNLFLSINSIHKNSQWNSLLALCRFVVGEWGVSRSVAGHWPLLTLLTTLY